MMKLKVFAALLCIATMGLLVSCSKEEKKEGTSVVGKWKCLHALVNDYDYRQSGSDIKIDTNYCDYIDENRIGKKWDFRQDGTFQRGEEQVVLYKHVGNKLTFRRPNDTVNMPGIWTIIELREDYMRLNFKNDRRANTGVGNYLEEAYILSKTE